MFLLGFSISTPWLGLGNRGAVSEIHTPVTTAAVDKNTHCCTKPGRGKRGIQSVLQEHTSKQKNNPKHLFRGHCMGPTAFQCHVYKSALWSDARKIWHILLLRYVVSPSQYHHFDNRAVSCLRVCALKQSKAVSTALDTQVRFHFNRGVYLGSFSKKHVRLSLSFGKKQVSHICTSTRIIPW